MNPQVQLVHDVVQFVAQIPDVDPKPPPGSKNIRGVVGNIKWGAALALMVAFFGGLIVWAGGRLVDHHRAGRIGVIMMLCGVFGGLLYAIGHQVINSFAGG